MCQMQTVQIGLVFIFFYFQIRLHIRDCTAELSVIGM